MRALLFALALVGCAHSLERPATYSGELGACTATSKTCAESIACENDVRAKYKRELRDPKAGCQ